jgi:predicted site-specific integrase-resolvase
MEKKHASLERVTPIRASEITGLSQSTLRRYERQGRIKPERTPSGERRYRLADLQALFSGGDDDTEQAS